MTGLSRRTRGLPEKRWLNRGEIPIEPPFVA